jgi:hypothetical protein
LKAGSFGRLSCTATIHARAEPLGYLCR